MAVPWFRFSHYLVSFTIEAEDLGTSLVVQWLRIHLPMQGTRVRSRVGELRSHMPWATKPARHS